MGKSKALKRATWVLAVHHARAMQEDYSLKDWAELLHDGFGEPYGQMSEEEMREEALNDFCWGDTEKEHLWAGLPLDELATKMEEEEGMV